MASRAEPSAWDGVSPDPFQIAVAELLHQVRAWRDCGGTLLHASVPIPPLDLLIWLHGNGDGTRVFWQDRAHSLSVAGLGAASECVADSPADYPTLLAYINATIGEQETAFLGGLAFDGGNGRDEWSAFPAARFVLPAIEVRQEQGQYRLAVNLLATSASAFRKAQARLILALGQLQFHLHPVESGRGVRVWRRIDTVNQAVFRERVEEILHHIGGGHLHKAVLARRVELHLNTPLDPFLALRRWHSTDPGSFCFALERADDLFMGCSPERLYCRRGRSLHTESLAGTVRRGRTPEEDERLERMLRQDPKLVHEHELVTRYVRQQIAPWVTESQSPAAPEVFKLHAVQHRYLPIRATLKPGVLDAQLLQALHPTPAVCGFPRPDAQALIEHQETVQRGWYSGVVGIVSPRHSEFAVAIRSALLHRDRVLCYSGVGIVAGSDADTEWNELEAKIEAFLSVLAS